MDVGSLLYVLIPGRSLALHFGLKEGCIIQVFSKEIPFGLIRLNT